MRGKFSGDRDEFLRQLHSQGIVLLAVKESKQRLGSGRFREQDFLSGIEQLYHLLQAGMRIDGALKTLIASLTREQPYRMWNGVLERVRQGTSLSIAMHRASEDIKGWKVPGLYSQIVAIGENVGDMAGALQRLLNHLEFRKSLVAELRSALAYPAFLLVMSLVSIVIVVLVIVPRFAAVFSPEELASLPLISRIVFSLASLRGDGVRLALLAVLSLFFLFWMTRGKLRTLVSRVLIEAVHSFPVTGAALRHLDLSDVYTAAGSMLSSNVALPVALSQAATTARLPALRFLVTQTATAVKQGQSVSRVWSNSHLIPANDIALVAVGESSAKLGEIFLKMGKQHLDQFRLVVRGAMALFEPAMILCLGCVIGFVVTGILLAVLSMTDVPGM